MKRFLEYLAEARASVRESDGGYRFKWSAIDLGDGRQAIPLDEAGFEAADAKVLSDPHYGPRRVFGPRLSQLGKAVVLPEGRKVPGSAFVKLALAEPSGDIGLSDAKAGEGLISFHGGKTFLAAWRFQLSFEEAISFMLAAKLGSVNPKMLVPLQNTFAPQYEDIRITVSPRTPADYDREAVLRHVKNPSSHFNRNRARSEEYGAWIEAAEGDVGETLLVKAADPDGRTRAAYDNYYTDRNWCVAVNPETKKVETLSKVHPKRLVQLYGLGRPTIAPKAKAAYGLFIPGDALLRSCQESAEGWVV